MKKFTLILIAVLAFVSCENEVDGPFAHDIPIEFGNLQTRAVVESIDGIDAFAVWAEMQSADGSSSDTLLTNERVYKDGSDWTYDNKRYWAYNYYFHFFATYPYGGSDVEATTFTQEGYPGYKLSFTTSDVADVDLMVAHKTEYTPMGGTYPESVDISFEHVLSQINFKVAKNSANAHNRVILNKLVLSGVKNKGFFYTYYTYTGEDVDEYWEIASDATAMELHPAVKSGELTFYGSGVDVVPVLQNPLLVIPQEVAAGTMQLSIEYSFYDIHPETGVATLVFKTTVNRNLPVITWEPGTSYMYNLTLDEVDNDILFGAPTITSGWGTSVQTGGTLIIQ